ncbi:MAG: RagB/SusD family nutrient uptake outer membrane protein [Rikenellaceae bacterium]
MKKIIQYILLAVIGLGSTSCEDFLYPDSIDTLTDDVFYSSDTQVESALTAIYYSLRTSTLGSSYTLNFNTYTDEDISTNNGTDSPMNYTVTSSNSTVSGLWTALYSALKNVGYLIDGLERNQENLSEDVYKTAKGEALFLRGYFHFLLVQWWGNPDTGLPMYIDKITSYEESSVKLSTVDEIYVQIVEDMEAAEVLLIDQTWASLGYSERVTVNAVRGMLARVCLHAAGFPNNGMYKGDSDPEFYYRKALSKGLLVTEMGHTLQTEYSQVFIDQVEDAYNTENIWEVGYSYAGDDNTDTNTAGAVGSQFGVPRVMVDLDTSYDLTDSLLVTQGKYANPRLYNLYGHGDDRREWNLPNFGYERNSLRTYPKVLTTGNCTSALMGTDNYASGTLPSTYLWALSCGKWRRVYEQRITRDENSTNTNHPLLRYADVLLMIAEAYIELGEPAKAAPYINQVRERSIPNATTTKVISRIITNATNQYGWAYPPEVEVISEGSGTGFEFFTQAEQFSSSGKGQFCIGISSAGTGYDVVPTLAAVPAEPTWAANTAFSKGDYVAVETATGYIRMYYASTSGYTTTVYPTHTTTLYDDDGTNTATTPTYTDALNEQGIAWTYKGGAYTIGLAPTLTVESIDCVVSGLESYVNTGSQADMRQFLRDERARELCFEALRRQDLKRWGILVETVKQGYDDYYGLTEGIPAGGTASNLSEAALWIQDYHNYMPIPLAQISLNRNLIQTAGY